MDGIAEEQGNVDACYARLGELSSHLEERLEAIRRAPDTGTGQDLLEKQALYDTIVSQLRSARAASTRLCFGRVDFEDGRRHHIGRIGLRDDNGEPILLDWRAPNAAGFYQATSVDTMGISRRRRIMTKDRTVTHLEDEELANPTYLSTDAATSAVEAPREGRMGDIIATIAADQDRIVRASMNEVTVVQGGPGTGKTVVALHRAAWLLYTHRDRLARDGVLVVGPSSAFLRYIDQVLPSLGETDVVLLTPGQLYPPVSTSLMDRADVARIKGDIVMAKVVANAVRNRVRIPHSDVTIGLDDGSTVTITAEQLAEARRSVPRNGTFHSNREPFLRRALDFLSRDRARRIGHDANDSDVRAAMLADLVDEPAVRRTLNLMWLPITPEQLIRRLLSDPATLRDAAHDLLTREEQAALLRPHDAPWTVDDVPLLDEAAERLGEWEPPTRNHTTHDDDYAELSSDDPFTRHEVTTTVAERALADRSWVYGHVVVDEAQELSRMAWHALARRCGRKSMTVVGDLHQTSHPAGARDWQEALGWVGERLSQHTLTVTYRITRQTAEAATELLLRFGGQAPELLPIREGDEAEYLTCGVQELAKRALEKSAAGEGRVAVVVPEADRDHIVAILTELSSDFGSGDDALDSPIALLTARETKGLEFDHVFVVNPDVPGAHGATGADIYVACTRATQTLHLATLV